MDNIIHLPAAFNCVFVGRLPSNRHGERCRIIQSLGRNGEGLLVEFERRTRRGHRLRRMVGRDDVFPLTSQSSAAEWEQ